MRKALVLAITLLMWVAQCHAAGFQSAQLSDEAGATIKLAIWYPSSSPASVREIGTFSQEVAMNGAIHGAQLPLVVISHGTGGSAFSHYDTALALANAGFVVAAPMHPGDNYEDRSKALAILERPRHIVAVINYMLDGWDKRTSLAPGRVGMFGFSSGGFTTLVNIGGTPDLERVPRHCVTSPGDFACKLLSGHQDQLPKIAMRASKALHDSRIKAAVVAAPALGFSFDAAALRNVRIPVQLWRAEDDVLLPHPWYAEAVYKSLPVQPEYHVVPKAGHFDFLAPCSGRLAHIAPMICTSQEGFDRTAFHRRFNKEVTAFFTKNLSRQ